MSDFAQAHRVDWLRPDNPGEGLLNEADWGSIAARFQLSERETSVAMLILEGKTRVQVARVLGCAPGTVRVYIDRLFGKLNVQDRVGVVVRILRAYLAERDPDALCLSQKSATCKERMTG